MPEPRPAPPPPEGPLYRLPDAQRAAIARRWVGTRVALVASPLRRTDMRRTLIGELVAVALPYAGGTVGAVAVLECASSVEWVNLAQVVSIDRHPGGQP